MGFLVCQDVPKSAFDAKRALAGQMAVMKSAACIKVKPFLHRKHHVKICSTHAYVINIRFDYDFVYDLGMKNAVY